MALAVGMTPAQYWDGDPWLYQAYVEAKRLRDEDASWARWESGLYVYEALARLAPALNGFSKGKSKPWVERPYGVDAEGDDGVSDEEASHAAVINYLMGAVGR